MGSDAPSECKAEFDKVMPAKPWLADTPVTAFEPLVNLIEQHTQSDMFRHVGQKYGQNGDFYDLAKQMDSADKDTDTTTFANGVTAQIEQMDGWPTKLVLEDKGAHLKETLNFHPATHSIEDDQVEYCGVSRLRKFSVGGEYYRSYNFDGGRVEKSGPLPVLKLD